MTNQYDEMKVAPDPAQAEERRRRLHARMADVAWDEFHRRLEPEVRVVTMTDPSGSDTSASPPSVPGAATRRDRTRGRRLVAAAAAVAVIAAAGIFIDNRTSDDDSTVAVAPTPTGKQISATPDFIQLGDGLVGVPHVVKADGRTYVVADHFDAADDVRNLGDDLWWFRPERSVLAAFDDDGDELWRTELERPSQVAAAAGDVWVLDDTSSPDEAGTLSRVDASNGRVVDQVKIGEHGAMVGAFGSVWVETGTSPQDAQVIRVDSDRSTTPIELPDRVQDSDDSPSPPEGLAAGPDAIWVPLGGGGVAVIDPDTNQVTVIPAKDIGHAVTNVAFDGDAAFVANDDEVTSIVDGEVVATVRTLPVAHLGSIDGVFGSTTQTSGGRFQVLRAKPPMEVEARYLTTVKPTGAMFNIDGEVWIVVGRNYGLRRLHLLP